MKKGIILLLLVAIGFIFTGETISAEKKVEKREYSLYVQQGKTYKLSKILSDIKDSDEDDTLKNCLKGKKVTWSVKKSQIKLTKNTIRVKKQGEFKLTGVTPKCKYILTLKSIPEKWPVIPKGVTSISIMKEGITVEVKDVNAVKTLCDLFDSADYRFNYNRTNWSPDGIGYMICFYTADAKVERKFAVAGTNLLADQWYKPKNTVDVCQYVVELYNRLLVEQNPVRA